MTTPTHQRVVELIASWLNRQLGDEQRAWFDKAQADLSEHFAERQLHVVLGMIPRRLGKDDLKLSDDDLEAADRVRPGWNPIDWSVDQAARILVVLTHLTGDGRRAPFAEQFADLCRTADVAELVALYRGLPLYPAPQTLETQAGEGLRTNMRAVFEAIAHNNPFAREQFDDHRWNQMVLKALFIDSTLAPIQGLDQRANAELAQILSDYAHERWAAGRAVTPELWRCIGPFATGPLVDDLARALASNDARERSAAALALSVSPDPAAKSHLASAEALIRAIETGELSWDALGNGES